MIGYAKSLILCVSALFLSSFAGPEHEKTSTVRISSPVADKFLLDDPQFVALLALIYETRQLAILETPLQRPLSKEIQDALLAALEDGRWHPSVHNARYPKVAEVVDLIKSPERGYLNIDGQHFLSPRDGSGRMRIVDRTYLQKLAQWSNDILEGAKLNLGPNGLSSQVESGAMVPVNFGQDAMKLEATRLNRFSESLDAIPLRDGRVLVPHQAGVFDMQSHSEHLASHEAAATKLRAEKGIGFQLRREGGEIHPDLSYCDPEQLITELQRRGSSVREDLNRYAPGSANKFLVEFLKRKTARVLSEKDDERNFPACPDLTNLGMEELHDIAGVRDAEQAVLLKRLQARSLKDDKLAKEAIKLSDAYHRHVPHAAEKLIEHRKEQLRDQPNWLAESFDLARNGVAPLCAPVAVRDDLITFAQLARLRAEMKPEAEIDTELMGLQALIARNLVDRLKLDPRGGYTRKRVPGDPVALQALETAADALKKDYNSQFYRVHGNPDPLHSKSLSVLDFLERVTLEEKEFARNIEFLRLSIEAAHFKNTIGPSAFKIPTGTSFGNYLFNTSDHKDAEERKWEAKKNLSKQVQRMWVLAKEDPRMEPLAESFEKKTNRANQWALLATEAAFDQMRSDMTSWGASSIGTVSSLYLSSLLVPKALGAEPLKSFCLAPLKSGFAINQISVKSIAAGAGLHGGLSAAGHVADHVWSNRNGNKKTFYMGELGEKTVQGALLGQVRSSLPPIGTDAIGSFLSYQSFAGIGVSVDKRLNSAPIDSGSLYLPGREKQRLATPLTVPDTNHEIASTVLGPKRDSERRVSRGEMVAAAAVTPRKTPQTSKESSAPILASVGFLPSTDYRRSAARVRESYAEASRLGTLINRQRLAVELLTLRLRELKKGSSVFKRQEQKVDEANQKLKKLERQKEEMLSHVESADLWAYATYHRWDSYYEDVIKAGLEQASLDNQLRQAEDRFAQARRNGKISAEELSEAEKDLIIAREKSEANRWHAELYHRAQAVKKLLEGNESFSFSGGSRSRN